MVVVPGESLGPEFDELAQRFGAPPIDLRRMRVAPEILERVPARLVYEYGVIPVALASDGVLIVASAEPSSSQATELSEDLGVPVEFVVSPRGILVDAIQEYHPTVGV